MILGSVLVVETLFKSRFLNYDHRLHSIMLRRNKEKKIGSYVSGFVWLETIDWIAESFVGFVQLFSDKTGTMLKSTVLVVYPEYSFLLNVSTRRGHWLIYNVHTLVGSLPVCCT